MNQLRARAPNAHIFLVVPGRVARDKWIDTVNSVAHERAAAGDLKVHAVVPGEEEAEEMTACGYPRLAERTISGSRARSARSSPRSRMVSYSGESSYSPSARLSKRVHCLSKRTFAVPVGPFRCLAMMSSAMFGSAESSRL